jgi:hypothetical protein
MGNILVIGPQIWCEDHRTWLNTHEFTSMQYSIDTKYVPGIKRRLQDAQLPFYMFVYIPKLYRSFKGSGSIDYVCRVVDVKLSETRIRSPWPTFSLDSTYGKTPDDRYEFWFKVDGIQQVTNLFDLFTFINKDDSHIKYANLHSFIGAARGRVLFTSYQPTKKNAAVLRKPPKRGKDNDIGSLKTIVPGNYVETPLITLEEYSQQLEVEIAKSRKDGKDARRKRLAESGRKPALVQVTSFTFARNPDVIVEVLERAGGKCEACLKDAPFIRAKDNTPYLEVHHQVQLSEGGDDAVDNALAVCPNCHRKMHYGLKLI